MSLRFQTTYQVLQGDDLGSATYWNLRLQDIDVRLNAVESYAATINGMADSVAAAGIARINTTLGPYMDSLTAEVNATSVTVAALEALVVTDQNNVIGQLDTILATAQTLIANLESLGTIQDGTF
jgi:hypothetical protein